MHLIPGVGAHRLRKLEVEHLEKLYRTMIREGSKPGRVHQVHRTIRAALNEAKRRKHIGENPAELARAPKVDEEEVEPCTVEEVQRLLEAAAGKRNSARWAVALALGLRQGETLGLMWPDINWDGWDKKCEPHSDGFCTECAEKHSPSLVVRRSRLRPRWEHGCTKPCGHKHGGYCPDRVPLRTETAATKSRAGKRGIGLPNELAALLRHHRDWQQKERETAAELWTETGYVFTTPTGAPLNPRTDYTEWKRLLERAKVPERRLHDARHTAATVLLLLGVPERAVMGIMGWSSTAMAARYQHITSTIRSGIAKQVGSLLWTHDDDRNEGDEGAAGVPARVA